MVLKLIVGLWALLTPLTVSAETILSKADADHIFSLNRTAWNAYAEQMIHPDGWKVNLSRHDTGIAVMAFDPKTGMGMSIQPLYQGDLSPPTMLIVGSFYPKGSLPSFTAEFKARIESAAQKDLGKNYSVTASQADVSAWVGIELAVTRTTAP